MLKLIHCSRISPNDPSLPRGLAIPRPVGSLSRGALAATCRIAAAILWREGSNMLGGGVFGAGRATLEAGRALDKYAALLEAINRSARGGRFVHVRREGVLVARDVIDKLRRYASFMHDSRSPAWAYVRAIRRERVLGPLVRSATTRRGVRPKRCRTQNARTHRQSPGLPSS